MRKLIVTEWISLDGIYDATLMAEWFNPYHSDSRAKAIQETINDCDVMLYGKNTYQMLYPYWSALTNNEMGVAEKINKVRKFVVSGTMGDAPWGNSSIISGDIAGAIRELKEEEGGSILVQGSGTLVKMLLAERLVDELKLLVQPHIMGKGTRLFDEELNAGLQLKGYKEIQNGVLQLVYEPK